MGTKQQTKAASTGKNLDVPSKSDKNKAPLQNEETKPSNVEKSNKHSKEKKGLWNWLKNNIDSKQIVNLIVAITATIIGGLFVFFAQREITNIVIHNRCYSRPYITFESDYTQVFRLSNSVPYLEYSVGESRWKELGTQNIVFGGSHGKLLLRGKSKLGTNGANISFASNAEVICTGDIRTLIDYEQYETTSTNKAVFASLFSGCSQLVVAPDLPIKDLATQCYRSMFLGCTSLKNAPILPATKLSDQCYLCMFYGCTSLKKAPELPATQLTERCYGIMFYGCTSLETVPFELPATELAERCYLGMFDKCTSLISPPVLPATKLADQCYMEMFKDCVSLQTIPQLPATTLANECYNKMFAGCTSLRYASELPATKLANRCYENMFSRCTSLEYPPALPATELAECCYAGMFYCCTSLKKTPLLPALEVNHFSYYWIMFYGCTSLSEATMLATKIDAVGFQTDPMFWLKDASPTGTFYKNKNATWSNDGIVPPGWKVVLVDP